MSNLFGTYSKDCIEIAVKPDGYENERTYIYFSVENPVEFIRDIKEKMLEHGNYSFEDER